MKVEILSEPIIFDFGKKINLDLEKSHEVFLPTDADWGYVFKIKMQKITFDILVYEVKEENKNKIEILPNLNIIQKIFKVKYLSELQNLIGIIKDSVVKIQTRENSSKSI